MAELHSSSEPVPGVGNFPQILASPSHGGGPSPAMAFDSRYTDGGSGEIYNTPGSTTNTGINNNSTSSGSSNMNWEPVRSRLLGDNLEEALAAATELRKGMEIVHTTEFPLLLSALLPAFSTILTHKTTPTPDTTSIQHKLRNTILELLSRMPSNEILRPHAPHLVAVALDVLNRDYEENALLATKIIFDLYKIFRSLPQDYVQPFLDFAVAAFRTLPGAVQRNFSFQTLMNPPTSSTIAKDPSAMVVDKSLASAAPSSHPASGTPKEAIAEVPSDSTTTTKTVTPSKRPLASDSTPMEVETETNDSTAALGNRSAAAGTDGGVNYLTATCPTPVLNSVQTPMSSLSPKAISSPKSPARLSPRSMASFRVLTECPLIVMLMFQLYPKFLRGNIPTLIQVMMEALNLRAPSVAALEHRQQQQQQQQATGVPTQSTSDPNLSEETTPKLDAAARRLYFSRSRELAAAQSKTLSFLTYLLRGFSHELKPYEDRLASNVVAIMSNCPREFISTRKELLVATRHFLNSDFRSGFFRHVDALLDEKILMGAHNRSYSDQSVLRPLGYAVLSDLVQHVRGLLTLPQISKIVSVFSRVLHDESVPSSTQYTAVRTLLSVVDSVFQGKDRDIQMGRDILVRVLRTLVEKLSALQPDISERSDSGSSTDTLSKHREEQGVFATGSPSLDSHEDLVKGRKNIVRAILVGAKTLIWYINNFRVQKEKERPETPQTRPGGNEEVYSGMSKITRTERALIDQYIVLAFPSILTLKESSSGDEEVSAGNKAAEEQYRDTLTYFAAAFTSLDSYDLRRILGPRLELFVEAVKDDPTTIIVPRHLLSANAATSYEFCTVMLNFLVDRMDNLVLTTEEGIHFLSVLSDDEASSSAQIKRLRELVKHKESQRNMQSTSKAYLLLYERILKSLSSYPENERALRPHLRTIVSTCLRCCLEKTDFNSDNYCMLLRYVFRSISAGKFEESYKELLPLIPTVLNGLFRVLSSSRLVPLRHTLIELILTIPARLSSLLPHLNLLLRVIVLSLESSSDDLVNLGLRTLEFWVDNLNPEFLFPEMSKETDVYVSVMKALSTHLRPAPYPYGLLTLRLLGKLGGKNRRVLREPMDVHGSVDTTDHHYGQLKLKCLWKTGYSPGREDKTPVMVPLPLQNCVNLLRKLSFIQSASAQTEKPNGTGDSVSWHGCDRLLNSDIELLDMVPSGSAIVEETITSQVEAAIQILHACLSKFMKPDRGKMTLTPLDAHDTQQTFATKEIPDMQSISTQKAGCDHRFETIVLGLLYGCSCVRGEVLFVKGLLAGVFGIVRTNHEHILRVDANGTPLDSTKIGEEENLGSLRPFGYFELKGPFESTANPLLVNNAIAQFLCQPSIASVSLGLEILKYVLNLPEKKPKRTDSDGDIPMDDGHELDRGARIFFESLLSSICKHCINSDWCNREGLHSSLCVMVETLGSSWGKRYENEIMNVALFSIKSVPRELSVAGVRSFRFLMNICTALYGPPRFMQIASSQVQPLVFDLLCPWKKKDAADFSSSSEQPSTDIRPARCPNDDVLQILVVEMASTKHLTRIAARYVLDHYLFNPSGGDVKARLEKHLSLLRRVLFSRSLRLLPLPEQVGVVEALAVLTDQLPDLIPLDDQHLLAFLSELLKMSSVADGEMTDSNLAGSVVDRNGFVVPSSDGPVTNDSETSAVSFRASSLFLRRECVVVVQEGRVVVGAELPLGVQLRVSTIALLRSVIRGHPDTFFDSDTSTPVGNIRPHVISLLFRSLVSHPIRAVTAAHDALRDVLTLSVVSTQGPDGAKSKSRLRKELLQTCIRPVLLNLREYNRLNVVLLRGLEQLLSLLSSWFNKTLGEKLLDHLQKWTDPNRIRSQNIWETGKEPEVPAAIIGLFVLLPQTSNFVEQLVKTTIKLEAALPAYKSQHVGSPFRRPLAKYLNKYSEYTVSFFMQRLRTPIYSEMFLDLINLEGSKQLRDYLGGRQGSVSLLNICFERPLAIVRSEKASVGSNGAGVSPSRSTSGEEVLSLHGIHPYPGPHHQKEAVLLREVEGKQRRLKVLQQEIMSWKDAVNTRGGPGSGSNSTLEARAALDEAKKQLKMARAACDKVSKELADVRKRYADEVAQKKAAAQQSPTSQDPRPMSAESLELQLQGFRLVESLVQSDPSYLRDHTDVLRAFRWLWRSKGRFLRMQYEECIPPRYHGESKALSSFLVSYSRTAPNDVDLFFELIRIFLQPSTSDFSFVRRFLKEAVSDGIDNAQKKDIMFRYVSLLAGESTEEIKILSLHLVVYPMLHFCLEEKPGVLVDQADGIDDAETPVSSSFMEQSIVQKFVSEVLHDDGKMKGYSDRLKVCLLQVSDIFLQWCPEYFVGIADEMMNYCWSLTKTEDSSCKNWAYFVMCRCISVLETPQRVLLQVYNSLLRSHQLDGKDRIQSALDLLLSNFPTKLDDAGLKAVIVTTKNVMFEEANSVAQLAHVFHVVVHQPEIFFHKRALLASYMINSLNRLGLPPNSQPEYRVLAVSIVDLVIHWEGGRGKHFGDKGDSVAKPIGRDPKGDEDLQSHDPFKNDSVSLDESAIETMVNFLIRLKILLADPKVDTATVDVQPKLDSLLQEILERWRGAAVRPVYFEKVVSLCIEDDEHSGSRGGVRSARDEGKVGKGSKSSGKSATKDDAGKKVSGGLVEIVLACVEVFKFLVVRDPTNSFLTENPIQITAILGACFRHARQPGETKVQDQLLEFLVPYLSMLRLAGPAIDERVVQSLRVWLETMLVDAETEYRKAPNHSSVDASRPVRARPVQASDDTRPEDRTALFALRVIKSTTAVSSSFSKSFVSSMLSLLNTIVKKHMLQAAGKQKQDGVSYNSQAGTVSIRQMYATPTFGILEEANMSVTQSLVGIARSPTKQPVPFKDLDDLDGILRSALFALDILGGSDIIYHFSGPRKSLMSLLQSILDTSNSFHLLLATVRLVGRWLIAGDSGPLTVRERVGFISKVSSFDFNGLSEVASQPLVEVVCHLVKQVMQSSRTAFFQGSFEKEAETLSRSVSACLLAAKTTTRVNMLDVLRRMRMVERRCEDVPYDVLILFFRSDLEPIGGRFWAAVLVELLLDSLVPIENEADGGDNVIALGPQESNSKSEKDGAADNFDSIHIPGQKGSRLSITSLQRLTQGDPRVCQDLLECLLPAAWKDVSDSFRQASLADAMQGLLSRPYHTQSFKKDVSCLVSPQNGVKSFLSAIVRLDPVPFLETDLLLFLARTYNCWYEALSVLQSQFIVLSGSDLSTAGKSICDRLLLGMRHCYRELGESNVWTTLALKSCMIPGSRYAAALEIYGRVDKATDAFSSLIELVESGEITEATDFEMDFWEEKWVSLQQQQQQVEIVSEYAKQSGNERIMLECAWRERDWDKVRSLCSSPPIVTGVEMGDPAMKICETLSAVAEGKLGDVENLHAQASQLALYRWQFLPCLSSGSGAHAQLLHHFHRLVEIRESGQIMVETNKHSSGKTLPDLKNLLNAWRHRLPNDEEPLILWDEIFTWRSHMFNAITSNFHWSEPSTLATLHDRPWTAIKVASIARKQGMRETSFLLLNRLTDNRAMDVSDVYLKLREQVLFYNNPESELERTGGLNLINTTNLSYFDQAQKAELFRLKAIFLASLRRTSKSNQAYCHSVQICPSHTKSWISWGGLCSSLGAMTEKQAEHAKDNTQEARAALTKKVAQYLAQAMGCFMEAVQIDPSERSRIHLPKVLWMLTKDGLSPGVLCQTLENRGTKLPPWVWLPWIPQLLTGLCRIEGRAIRALLSRLVKAYPQAAYYPLRSFYLERRDVERAKGGSVPPGQHMGSVAYAEEMMSTLRRSHASLWSSLEAILEELIVKFRPSYEEELLATISALLERAESHAEKQSLPDKKRTEDEEALVSSWTKTLSRIAAKFFKDTEPSTSSNRRDERGKKTSEFKRKYKKDFEDDFKVTSSDLENAPSETEAKPELQHYINKLQLWKEKLEAQVSRTPASLPLMESSHSLAMYYGDVPDLWPGSCDTKYSSGSDRNLLEDDPSLRLQSSASSSAAIARKAALNAAILGANAAAKEGIGGEYGGGSASIEIPGQYCPNSSSSSDVRPCPELHAHLVKFEPFVQVLRRNDQLVRRCGMVGSDGKTYRFLLQFAIPHWTRSDERTSQTSYVVDKFIRQNLVSSRHHLCLQPNAAIPVAQRLRMTPDYESRLALDEVYRTISSKQKQLQRPAATYFVNEITNRLKEKLSSSSTEEEKTIAEREVRLDVYNEVCTMVQRKIFLRYLQEVLSNPESFFLFRRALSVQLAANSLLQYVFSVAERTPQRFVLLLSNARVLSPDFRITYSNQGFIESPQVPFRMTPNVEIALGEQYIQGIFVRSMAMIAAAVKQHKEEFDPILRLLMRDDILSWYTKSQAKTDAKTQELERQLIERVSKNVYTLQSRIAECTPSSKINSDVKNSMVLDKRVNDLLKSATDPQRLCMMPASYHGWL